MSVTFWAPEAPQVEVLVDYEDGYGETLVSRSSLPEVNMSYGDARQWLQLLGLNSDPSCELEGDLWGSASPVQFKPVIERLQVLCSDPRARAAGLRPAWETRGRRGARIIDCGRSDEYLALQSQQLLELFVQARQKNLDIHWS